MSGKVYEFNGGYCRENQYLFLMEVKDSIPADLLNIIAKIHNDDWLLYNYDQMQVIYDGYSAGLPMDKIELYAKVGKNGIPMYSSEKMKYIKTALLEPKIFSRQLSNILAVTGDEKPLYSLYTTQAIMLGCRHGLSDEKISLYTQLNSKHRPLFSGEEALALESLLRDLNKEQFVQLKESIEDGLNFEQFSSYINKEMPANKMRLYRALIKLGCDTDDIGMFEKFKVDYDILKNVKYAMQMNQYFKLGPNARMISGTLSDVNLADNVSHRLQDKYKFDNDSRNIVNRCLIYKMPPEQIDILIDPGYKFDNEEMKDLAIAFLNGLSIDEVKEVIDKSTKTSQMMSELIEEALKEKFMIGVPEEEVEFKTDWFDEQYR